MGWDVRVQFVLPNFFFCRNCPFKLLSITYRLINTFLLLFFCSGVAVHCADCGSSNSDITEPCSPLSTTSLDEMPPTAVGRSTGAPASVVRRPPPPPSPVGDTNSVQWPWTDPPNKRPKQGKITEYFRAKGGNKSSMLAAANVASLNKESAVQQPWVN